MEPGEVSGEGQGECRAPGGASRIACRCRRHARNTKRPWISKIYLKASRSVGCLRRVAEDGARVAPSTRNPFFRPLHYPETHPPSLLSLVESGKPSPSQKKTPIPCVFFSRRRDWSVNFSLFRNLKRSPLQAGTGHERLPALVDDVLVGRAARDHRQHVLGVRAPSRRGRTRPSNRASAPSPPADPSCGSRARTARRSLRTIFT